MKKSHINSLLKISKDPQIWIFFEKGDTLKSSTAYVTNAIKQRKLNKEYPLIVLKTQQDCMIFHQN